MINYKLDKEIKADKIINDIQNLILQNQQNLSDKILHICIKDIINHTGDSPILKLPYHQ